MRMQRYEWNNKDLEQMYGKGFWRDEEVIYSHEYSDYVVKIHRVRNINDNGGISKYWAVHLINRRNPLETYCLEVIWELSKLWQYVATLELEVTVSDFQYLESLELFQELVRGAFGNEAELEGINAKTGDLWLFIPIDKHHVEAWQKVYLGEGRYENSFQYMESINWDKMTPLERYKILGWRY